MILLFAHLTTQEDHSHLHRKNAPPLCWMQHCVVSAQVLYLGAHSRGVMDSSIESLPVFYLFCCQACFVFLDLLGCLLEQDLKSASVDLSLVVREQTIFPGILQMDGPYPCIWQLDTANLHGRGYGSASGVGILRHELVSPGRVGGILP